MVNFIYEPKNSRIQDKPKVYFTCHPEDFDLYFDKVCKDILSTHDCVIFYTDSLTEEIDERYKESDLGRMNLFVVPVTLRLLSQPNRTMNSDIAYAKQKNIPILPLMMESDIDELYAEPDKFGELQYLNPHSKDVTEIKYEEKLKKYLNSVLLSNEMIQRVRTAFDAYIFLSYRKKNRGYANELMRMIHSNPECRDIAIWFDEFLTPGESFKSTIEKMLYDSKLFTLLITPQVLQKVVDKDGNEKDNYIISTELPLAQKNKENKGTDILAVEMEYTNREALAKIGIDDCVNPHDYDAFRERLLNSIKEFAITSNDNNPMHNFLIGLAYLEGIDMEIDREYALQLITLAAEANLEEAMRMLVSIYSNSSEQELNYAIMWQSRILRLSGSEHDGESQDNTKIIEDLLLMSDLHERCNKISEAIEDRLKVNEIYEKILTNTSCISNLLYKYVQNIYTIAKLISYKDNYDNQAIALSYLVKAVDVISDSYTHKMEDSVLLIIAEMYETIAQYIITKSRRFDKNIDSNALMYAARRMRRSIEKHNNINLTAWLKNNSLYYKGTEENLKTFFLESGLSKMINDSGSESPDAGTDYHYDNPLIEIEELLIIAVAIYDYLSGKDLRKYGTNYVRSLGKVASLWIALEAYPAAIDTLTMNIQFLRKYESEFYCDESEVIIEQYELLASAYKSISDQRNSLECLKTCTLMLEARQLSRESKMHLSRTYSMMADVAGHSKDSILYLIKAINLLENLSDANILLDKEVFILMECYCCLLGKYANPDFWDSESFFDYFAKAYKICQKYAPTNEIQSAMYFNKLHRLRVILEDCRTIESVQFVGTLFNLAFNNCKTLLISDSEHSNYVWLETISELIKFDQYVHHRLQSNRLIEWEKICVQLITEYLSFIVDFAEETPLNLIDHNHRTSFSDYFLLTGQADNEFIEKYTSLLYVFFDLFINLIYHKGFLKKEFDIELFIRQSYSNAINCQKQGYAFQIFNKEQTKLLNMITK